MKFCIYIVSAYIIAGLLVVISESLFPRMIRPDLWLISVAIYMSALALSAAK